MRHRRPAQRGNVDDLADVQPLALVEGEQDALAVLVAERDEGRGILLVSLELEEILALSDRILVIYEGEIVGELPPTATEEQLGILMTGGGRSRGVAA